MTKGEMIRKITERLDIPTGWSNKSTIEALYNAIIKDSEIVIVGSHEDWKGTPLEEEKQVIITGGSIRGAKGSYVRLLEDGYTDIVIYDARIVIRPATQREIEAMPSMEKADARKGK